ncbi:MAG: hypothetical protein GX683_03215 [Ruminococcaceae bacterium]|nr:hypothetical protein [Oscillospiraceae bacterium]
MKKIIIALVLFAAAGALAFVLKDYIDRTNPDYAIPQISVTADSSEVATVVSGYSWQFAFGEPVVHEETPVTELSVVTTELLGGENLGIVFSQPTKSYTVRRSESFSYDFSPTEDMEVPFESGGYLYEVVATFESGTVQYYFYIVVAE